MEEVLYFNGCKVVIENDQIKCRYRGHFGYKYWQIALNNSHIGYKGDDGKEVHFSVDEIEELQFEMGNGALRHGDIPAATGYVILKSDPEPQDLLYLMVSEQYSLSNQTKAYEFCDKILNYIGQHYGISVKYKLSIDTRKKRIGVVWILLIFIITTLLIWFRLQLD